MITKEDNAPQDKRGWAWIWLAYTGFLFIDPFMDPSVKLWLETLGVFAVFVLILKTYIWATDCKSPVRFWMIGATFALAMFTFPWNAGGSTFFVYAAAFLPFSVRSTARVLTYFALMAAAIVGEKFVFHLPWPNVLFTIFLLLIIGGGNIFFAEQKRADNKLKAAQEENIGLAAVAERERIARDLHDVLGHTLSVIVLKAELAGRLIERDPARAASEIGEVERTARTALAEVREAIGGYRARGLAAEIELARQTLAAAGVDLRADAVEMDGAKLSAAEETVLALALREAVTNIVRHANAHNCRLRFVMEGGTRRLVVEDDGNNTSAKEGNGLRGMRERVEALGGKLLLERERGTRLQIDLPLRTEIA